MASRHATTGFTLLELILSTSVLVAIVSILVQVITEVQNTWRRGADSSETTLSAHRILSLLSDDLSGTVAEYTDPNDPSLSERDPPPFLFAIRPETDSEADLDESAEAEHTSSGFSRLIFTTQQPRVIWDGGAAECSSLPRPSRRPTNSRLRSAVGVLYSIEPLDDVDPSTQSSDPSTDPTTPVRFALVRRVTGLSLDTPGDWWSQLEDESPGEVLARNVVWFSASTPTFPSTSTNHLDSAGLTSYEAYATRSEDSLDLPANAEIGPLPPLLDLVLGLVPERDLALIEAIDDPSERAALLSARTRIYSLRAELPRPRTFASFPQQEPSPND